MLPEADLLVEAARWASVFFGGLFFGICLVFASLPAIYIARAFRQLARD
ncbi:MAG: hypothetical protein AAGH99_00305 [Planctomycetota bacterium]